MKKLIYRLKEDRTPESWELPLRNIFLPRVVDENTGMIADKLIHYLPGAPSIWAEDYQGDKKPFEAEYFENGVLEVPVSNVLLIEILAKHRFNGIYYELFDNDVQAQTKLDDFIIRDQASELVNTSDDLKIKALALVLIGQETISWTALRCKAELKEKAYTNPRSILDEADKPNYQVKYLVGLAYLQELIKDNDTQTAVVWKGTNGVIIRIAVGESGIDKMTEFLSVKSESSLLTLQRLGELGTKLEEQKIKALDTSVLAPVVDTKSAAIISAKDQEIAELRALLAATKAPLVAVETIQVDQTTAEVKADAALITTLDDEPVKTLEDLRGEYFDKTGNAVPVNKKNDINWLLSQLK